MPFRVAADHAGTMATGAGDFRAASGGKCCHGAGALVASSSAHLRCGCGPCSVRAGSTSGAQLQCALVRAPTCGSPLHMRVAPGPAIGESSVQHLVPLVLPEKNPREVLGVCVCGVCTGWWYHSQLKKGCGFAITNPCKSSIRHLAFLCSR